MQPRWIPIVALALVLSAGSALAQPKKASPPRTGVLIAPVVGTTSGGVGVTGCF